MMLPMYDKQKQWNKLTYNETTKVTTKEEAKYL